MDLLKADGRHGYNGHVKGIQYVGLLNKDITCRSHDDQAENQEDSCQEPGFAV